MRGHTTPSGAVRPPGRSEDRLDGGPVSMRSGVVYIARGTPSWPTKRCQLPAMLLSCAASLFMSLSSTVSRGIYNGPGSSLYQLYLVGDCRPSGFPVSSVFHLRTRLSVFHQQKLDGVLGTQTSRLLLSYILQRYIEATALLFVQQHVKSAIIVDHVTPPHGQIWPLQRMIVRELRQ